MPGLPACSPQGLAVTARRSGDSQDAELERLRRQYPRWRIRRGLTTGGCGQLPPRDHATERELIGAGDLDELAQRLAQAEERYDL